MTKDYYLEYSAEEILLPKKEYFDRYSDALSRIGELYECMPLGALFDIYRVYYVGEPAKLYSVVRKKTEAEKELEALKKQMEMMTQAYKDRGEMRKGSVYVKKPGR